MQAASPLCEWHTTLHTTRVGTARQRPGSLQEGAFTLAICSCALLHLTVEVSWFATAPTSLLGSALLASLGCLPAIWPPFLPYHPKKRGFSRGLMEKRGHQQTHDSIPDLEASAMSRNSIPTGATGAAADCCRCPRLSCHWPSPLSHGVPGGERTGGTSTGGSRDLHPPIQPPCRTVAMQPLCQHQRVTFTAAARRPAAGRPPSCMHCYLPRQRHLSPPPPRYCCTRSARLFGRSNGRFRG